MNRNLRIGLSVAISAIFLAVAARGVKWDEALLALRAANYLYAVPMVLIVFWTLYIRAQRWRLLLRPLGTPRMRNLIDATNIGFMANMVLPLRMGEVIRAVMLSRKEKEPVGGILATILVERVFDLLTVVLLFGLSASLVAVSETVREWGYRLCGVAVLMTAGVVFVRWQEALALRWLRLMLKVLPARIATPIEQFFVSFVRALEILDSPLTFIQLIAWSLYLWVTIVASFLLGILAFGLPIPPVLAAIVVTSLVAIAVSAPSAPGYIGAFQLGCKLALVVFGVAESQAFAYSIAVHLSQFIGVIAAGVFSLMRGGGGMSLRQIEEVSEADVRQSA